jgi:hypothetical protein
MSTPRIDITIDRLVLRGFPAAQRDALASSLQLALGRHFTRAALAGDIGASRDIASLRARPISGRDRGPQYIGTAAAREIARVVRP